VQPPPGPTGVKATVVSRTRIDLSWNAVSGATKYLAYQATTPGGPYTQFAAVTTTTATAGTLTPATTYYFVVKAQTANGLSQPSAEVSAKTSP
jgi:hypothetical protein